MYQKNLIDIKVKSDLEIILDEILNPFNIF